MLLPRGRGPRMLLAQGERVSTAHEVHQVSVPLHLRVSITMPSLLHRVWPIFSLEAFLWLLSLARADRQGSSALPRPGATLLRALVTRTLPFNPPFPPIHRQHVFLTRNGLRYSISNVSRTSCRNSIDPALTRFWLSQTLPTCPANSSGKVRARPAPPVPSVTTSELPPRPSASILQRCVGRHH